MKVIQASTWSFEKMDQYIHQGCEAFSVSRFGYEYLKDLLGQDYKVITPKESTLLRMLTKAFKGEGRNIALQIKCAKEINKVDLLYYPTDRHAWLLAILRKLRICRKPILMVSHFTYNTDCVDSKIKKLALALERNLMFHSIDKVVFAGEHLLEVAKNDYKIPTRHQSYVHWGADLNYFSRTSPPPIYNFKYFLAAGSANRDYDTLIKAFEKLPYQLVISCKPQNFQIKLPANVHIFDFPSQGMAASAKLRNLYHNCIGVLLPISHGNHVPNGASVLVEALACGKPIIATDLKSNFLDIEKEGIGFTCKLHDVEDWVEKVNVLATTEQYDNLVNNCKSLAKVYNYENFAKEVYDIMRKMVNG